MESEQSKPSKEAPPLSLLAGVVAFSPYVFWACLAPIPLSLVLGMLGGGIGLSLAGSPFLLLPLSVAAVLYFVRIWQTAFNGPDTPGLPGILMRIVFSAVLLIIATFGGMAGLYMASGVK